MTDRVVSDEYENFLLQFVRLVPQPAAARVLKVSEEGGEAAQAFMSHSGWQWRKDDRTSAWGVCMELADTAMTAMVAIIDMGYGPDQVMQAQRQKTLARMRERGLIP